MSIFSSVKSIRHKKNNFNLSHDNMFTCDIGTIVPCFLHFSDIPNSDLRVGVSQITRFQSLLAPLQHQVDAYIHFWKVPRRLLDSKFPDFISGMDMRNGNEYIGKYFTLSSLRLALSSFLNEMYPPGTIHDDLNWDYFIRSGTLFDMLGYPVCDDVIIPSSYSTSQVRMTDVPLLTYFWIFVQRYINLNIPLTFTTAGEVPETFNLVNLVEEWRADYDNDCSFHIARCMVGMYSLFGTTFGLHTLGKDYFTSALPFVQVGDPVTLNLIGQGEVRGTVGTDSTFIDYIQRNVIPTGYTVSTNYTEPFVTPNNSYTDYNNNPIPVGTQVVRITETATGTDKLLVLDESTIAKFKHGTLFDQDGLDHDLYVDYSEAQAITVEELRVANALQSLKESFARYGSRFQEWLKGFFNQESSDRTLQLPQYLGGGKVPINISEIEQTSASANDSVTGEGTPLGTLAGKGIGLGGNFCGFKTHIEEPSIVIGLFFLKPKTMYGNNGLNRHLLKINDIFDFFNPKTEHLGEQSVKQSELYFTGNNQDVTFGYQARYAEYRFMPSEIHGQFANTLNFWHMGRIFASAPTLSKEFIYINPREYKRPFAITEVKDSELQNVMNWLHFEVRLLAPMSKFGTPMLLN